MAKVLMLSSSWRRPIAVLASLVLSACLMPKYNGVESFEDADNGGIAGNTSRLSQSHAGGVVANQGGTNNVVATGGAGGQTLVNTADGLAGATANALAQGGANLLGGAGGQFTQLPVGGTENVVTDGGTLSTVARTTGNGGTSTSLATTNGGSPSNGGYPSNGGTSTSLATTIGGAAAGARATGGAASGGLPPSGGSLATGGVATGGVATGGVTTGGVATGGVATGGVATGGVATGGVATGGVATGGVATGGVATGGVATGGVATGGAPTPVRCDNLSQAAGAPGHAKPSGALGGLTVLDWAGFTGAVSFTFDDGNSSQISNYAALNATGAHATFFLVTGWSNATNAIWQTAVADGHELGNHTQSHSSSASLSDLQAAESFIASHFGVTAYSMASPNGDSSWVSVAPQVVLLNRGVNGGRVSPRDATNPYNLPAYLPPTGASTSTMDSQVNAARTSNQWSIFCVHGFTGDSVAYQPVPVTAMTTTMANAVSNGVWAESLTNVGAYWLGQKAISASATTSATWTLPAHFPPNMCVRITVTGGTVKQNGKEIPWNDRGYYQIALDAGAVSVE